MMSRDLWCFFVLISVFSDQCSGCECLILSVRVNKRLIGEICPLFSGVVRDVWAILQVANPFAG